MDLGKIFKDKLDSFSQSPSDDLWGKISSSSEFTGFNKAKRRKRIIKTATFASFFAATAVVIFFALQNNVKNDDNSAQLTQSIDKKSQNFAQNDEKTIFTTEDQNTIKESSYSEKNTEKTDLKNDADNSHSAPVAEANNNFSHNQIDNVSFTPNVSQGTSEVSSQRQPSETTGNEISEILKPKNTKGVETNDFPNTPLLFSHDTTICRNSKLTLYVLNAEKVTWNIGSREPVIEIYPEVTTTYHANVKKSDGQDTAINIKVEVLQCGLYIPNAFTPNGDGINDEFKIEVPEELQIASFEMSIFEPSGRMIFHSKNPTQGWDGNYQGGKSPQGAYFYVVKYKDKMNEKHINKGQLILYR